MGLFMISKTCRQMTGVVMRFWPPGHWSGPKSMGQFSIATRTPSSSASCMMPGQTAATSRRLPSMSMSWTRPMKVVTMLTPSIAEARMTFFRCSTFAARLSGSPSRVLG